MAKMMMITNNKESNKKEIDVKDFTNFDPQDQQGCSDNGVPFPSYGCKSWDQSYKVVKLFPNK